MSHALGCRVAIDASRGYFHYARAVGTHTHTHKRDKRACLDVAAVVSVGEGTFHMLLMVVIVIATIVALHFRLTCWRQWFIKLTKQEVTNFILTRTQLGFISI